MKRIITLVVSLILLLAVLVLAYVRFAPSDVGTWQQDPGNAKSTGKPNEYRLIGDTAPIFDVSEAELTTLLTGFLSEQPRITMLSKSPDMHLLTYIQRSLIMGYPDYITTKISLIGENQSKLEVYSRSRFGYSDLGVNKMRVDQWVAAIQRLVSG